MIKLAAALVALAAVALVPFHAEGGPYCGRSIELAPAPETTLPVAPTIAIWVEDGYYGGKRQSKAKAPKVGATIDGKAVSITTRDVRGVEGMIRFLKIGSKKAGKLEISVANLYSKEMEVAAAYTISAEWSAPESAKATIVHGRDTRLAPYRYQGELALVQLDVPAIAFTLRWRENAKEKWKTRPFPAHVEDTTMTLRLGQTMCGMIENVPLKQLEAGIEVELTAKLPNGATIAVTDVPNPLVMPPLTKEQQDSDKRDLFRKP